ncbi:DUF6597 domain-containing transcriptional factor [Actinoplanes sp. CA-142083]|uniref:DUF6597 domain-containing transcriptional factor n=1 Tax=Actinoplanes sp. CA-142083 TaxID=3239903 RepID=UPI003D8E04F6
MAGQTYREMPPVAALAGHVSMTWVQQVGATPYVHRSVPSGGVELVCRVGAPPFVVGPLTGPRIETLAPGSTVVGLRFRPGAAAAVLGVPVPELVEAGAAGDPSDVLAALQELVGRRVDAVDPLVAETVGRLMAGRTAGLGSIWSSLEVSERSFRRRCRSAIGMGPKALHRILRFQGFLARAQAALARGRRPAEEGLARLAVDAGYADQAHLTRECVRLTGDTPRRFLGDVERSCGCGHDHGVSMAVLFNNGGPSRP